MQSTFLLFVQLEETVQFVQTGSRKIAPEENYPPALFLALILNQTLTLTGGAIFQTSTMVQQSHRACERTKSKQKQKQSMSYLNSPRVLLFGLAHKQCNGFIKGWLHSLTSEPKGSFLSKYEEKIYTFLPNSKIY